MKITKNRKFIEELKELVAFHVEHNPMNTFNFKYASAVGELLCQINNGKYNKLTNEINEIVRNEMNRRIKDAINDKLKTHALLNGLKERK